MMMPEPDMGRNEPPALVVQRMFTVAARATMLMSPNEAVTGSSGGGVILATSVLVGAGVVTGVGALVSEVGEVAGGVSAGALVAASVAGISGISARGFVTESPSWRGSETPIFGDRDVPEPNFSPMRPKITRIDRRPAAVTRRMLFFTSPSYYSLGKSENMFN